MRVITACILLAICGCYGSPPPSKFHHGHHVHIVGTDREGEVVSVRFRGGKWVYSVATKTDSGIVQEQADEVSLSTEGAR